VELHSLQVFCARASTEKEEEEEEEEEAAENVYGISQLHVWCHLRTP
jgi:hypothetical protein